MQEPNLTQHTVEQPDLINRQMIKFDQFFPCKFAVTAINNTGILGMWDPAIAIRLSYFGECSSCWS